MKPFADRFPALFHVTDRAALPGIRAHGLLSAAALCRSCAVPADRLPALLEHNRGTYAALAPGAALRRQGMPDGPLSRRLAPGLDPAGWRRLVNGMVFLFARPRDAETLRACEPSRDQVILRFETAALLGAGLDLRACRYNNGYLDRRPRDRPRLRGPGDYVPVPEWTGGVPGEVTAGPAIPPCIGFEVQAAG